MKITTFALKVAGIEGKKKQVNIAQITEILQTINRLTRGLLYAAIRIMPLVALLLAAPAFAAPEFTASYDHYITPNGGNNYDDAQGYSLGIEHGISGNLKGRAELTHITDINFAEARDPKGSWGELRGYGALYSLVYELPYSDRLTFRLIAGAGPYWWDFKENPLLQDNAVIVSVDPSFAFKAGVGSTWKLKNDWTLTAEAGWFDTNIHKEARDAHGTAWNILDAGDNIGLQYIYVRAGIRKKF